MQPPNEVRNFVHKRIIGGITSFVSSGLNPLAGIRGFVATDQSPSSRRGGQPTAPRSLGGSGCRPGNSKNAQGRCRPNRPGFVAGVERFLPGGETGTIRAGAAVMGQYGAALEPFVEARHVRTCLPGMVLGKDGLCYNRRDITNKEREYPKGTRPLGTPGEMAALRKAASFGRRMETTVKRMQKIGVLKKAPGRKAAPRPKMLTSGEGVRVVNVE